MRRTNGLVCAGVLNVVRACGIGGVGGLGAATVIAFGAGTMVLGGVASADVKPVPARVMIVTKDGTAMRCDTGNIYYPVRVLKAGDLLTVDGEATGWVRAEYPAGTRAYVRADEATFDAPSKTVRLTKATKLMAANDMGARPWWPLMPTDIAAGTTFSPAEAVRAADGSTEGYLVPAPAGAHGYVKTEQVRNATAQEVAAKAPTPAAPVGATPAPAETTPIAAETKPVEISMKPTETRPAPAQPSMEIIEVKPAAPTIVTETRVVAPRPAPSVPAPVAPQITRRIDDVSVLRDLFASAMQPESDGGEITTVISEFNRKIDALPTSGDDGKIRAALVQRLEALRVRQDIADSRRRFQDTSAIDDRVRQAHLAIETAQKQAIYAIVGRMLPSTVYDGKRGMPLMYRVESADFSSTRTIGYVVPREGMDFLPVMGKIVGIVGESRMDPALGLNLVMPVRVDEMRVTGGAVEVIPNAISLPTVPVAPMPPTPATPESSEPAAKPMGEPVASPAPDTGDINK